MEHDVWGFIAGNVKNASCFFSLCKHSQICFQPPTPSTTSQQEMSDDRRERRGVWSLRGAECVVPSGIWTWWAAPHGFFPPKVLLMIEAAVYATGSEIQKQRGGGGHSSCHLYPHLSSQSGCETFRGMCCKNLTDIVLGLFGLFRY